LALLPGPYLSLTSCDRPFLSHTSLPRTPDISSHGASSFSTSSPPCTFSPFFNPPTPHEISRSFTFTSNPPPELDVARSSLAKSHFLLTPRRVQTSPGWHSGHNSLAPIFTFKINIAATGHSTRITPGDTSRADQATTRSLIICGFLLSSTNFTRRLISTDVDRLYNF